MIQEFAGKTIGIIINELNDTYQKELVRGLESYIHSHNLNLIIFVGRTTPLHAKGNQYHIIKDFLIKQNIAGLILVGDSMVDNNFTKSHLKDFCLSLGDLPVVSINLEIELDSPREIPTIMVDNKGGIKKVIDYLTGTEENAGEGINKEKNNYKYEKIAFIQGPEYSNDARERLDGYLEAVQEKGLKVDESFIAPQGPFIKETGKKGIDWFFNNQKITPDAIVCADDEIAFGAYSELVKNNKIPGYDIALCGFDDLEMSQYLPVPLTTVKQPLFEIGSEAGEVLHDLINKKKEDKGKQNPDHNSDPAESQPPLEAGSLANRKSKKIKIKETEVNKQESCNNGKVIAFDTIEKEPENLGDAINNKRGEIIGSLDTIVSQSCKYKEKKLVDQDFYNELLDHLIADLKEIQKGQSTIHSLFIKKIITYIFKIIGKKNRCLDCFKVLANVLYDLHDSVKKVIDNESVVINTLFKQAHETVSRTALDFLSGEQLKSKYNSDDMRIISHKIISSLTMDELRKTLIDGLQRLGLTCFYLVLYDEAVKEDVKRKKWKLPEKSWLEIGFYKAENSLIREQSFDNSFETKLILPDKVTLPADRFSLKLLPLSTKTEHLGYVVFDYKLRDNMLYEDFRSLITNAVKSVQTLEEIIEINSELDKKNSEQREKLEKMTSLIVRILKNISLMDDEVTGKHIERVSAIAVCIARHYGCSPDFRSRLELNAPLHDIGKIIIADNILKKPGHYTKKERTIMEDHVEFGADLLKTEGIDNMAVNIALSHHEKWEGTGYKRGIKKEEIPLEARIVAIADVYDALVSVRPYKPGMPHEKAVSIIKQDKERGKLPGFNLEVTAYESEEKIPKEGKELVIAAKIDNTYSFIIFDSEGKIFENQKRRNRPFSEDDLAMTDEEKNDLLKRLDTYTTESDSAGIITVLKEGLGLYQEFDPKLVGIFVKNQQEIKSIRDEYQD